MRGLARAVASMFLTRTTGPHLGISSCGGLRIGPECSYGEQIRREFGRLRTVCASPARTSGSVELRPESNPWLSVRAHPNDRCCQFVEDLFLTGFGHRQWFWR